MKTQGEINEISASIGRLIQQLNEFKPMNERNLGNLKGEVSADVLEKMSKMEEKVDKLSAELAK